MPRLNKLSLKSTETTFGQIYYYYNELPRKPIVYLHGGYGKPDVVNILHHHFSPKGIRIISPYLPGHGLSYEIPRKFSFADFMLSIKEFILELNLNEPLNIIGRSFGGRVAWELCLDHNINIKKLVLIDPFLDWTNNSTIRILGNMVIDKFFDRIRRISSKATEIDHSESFIEVHKPQYNHAKRLEYCIKSMGTPSCISNSDIDILVLWGENDTVVKIKDQEHNLNKLSRSKLEVHKGSHYWHYENPIALIDSLNKFLIKY